MRSFEEIDIDVFQHIGGLTGDVYRLTHVARQYPTIVKRYRAEIEEAREQLNDILARLERNWDQVAAE